MLGIKFSRGGDQEDKEQDQEQKEQIVVHSLLHITVYATNYAHFCTAMLVDFHLSKFYVLRSFQD